MYNGNGSTAKLSDSSEYFSSLIPRSLLRELVHRAHDEELRGGSPLRALEIGTASLGQYVESDLESVRSR